MSSLCDLPECSDKMIGKACSSSSSLPSPPPPGVASPLKLIPVVSLSHLSQETAAFTHSQHLSDQSTSSWEFRSPVLPEPLASLQLSAQRLGFLCICPENLTKPLDCVLSFPVRPWEQRPLKHHWGLARALGCLINAWLKSAWFILEV